MSDVSVLSTKSYVINRDQAKTGQELSLTVKKETSTIIEPTTVKDVTFGETSEDKVVVIN